MLEDVPDTLRGRDLRFPTTLRPLRIASFRGLRPPVIDCHFSCRLRGLERGTAILAVLHHATARAHRAEPEPALCSRKNGLEARTTFQKDGLEARTTLRPPDSKRASKNSPATAGRNDAMQSGLNDAFVTHVPPG